MENIVDSEIMKRNPEARQRMLDDENIIRALIKARGEGTLIETESDLCTSHSEESEV